MKITGMYHWRYPISIERDYAKILVAYVKELKNVLLKYRENIVKYIQEQKALFHRDTKMDDDDDEADSLFNKLEIAVATMSKMYERVKKKADELGRYVKRQFNTIYRNIFGRTPDKPIEPDDSAIDAQKRLWISDNLALIRSIDLQTIDRLRPKITELIINSGNLSDKELEKLVADIIEESTEISRKRAIRIAVDQVGKLHSRMTRWEQERQGVEEYVWRTMLDNRVRPSHRVREGQIFSWNNPPADGHPGEPPNCRCRADPVFKVNFIPRGKYKVIS